MADEDVSEEAVAEAAPPQGVGPQLRAAREAKGLTLEQVAAETRISKRHLEHIEDGAFEALASRTYAVGFARTYARVVELNPHDVVTMVRAEMDEGGMQEHGGHTGGTFEPGDPARAPGGKLVWFSLFAVVLLLVGIFFAARILFEPAAELPSLTEQQAVEEAEAEQVAASQGQGEAVATVDASGDVVFTAEGEVWVRFYDAQNRVLTERTMAEGETYTIPADAEGPRIITGRPDLLAIAIGGQGVPKLSEELETIENVPVSAEALLGRAAPAPAASPGTASAVDGTT